MKRILFVAGMVLGLSACDNTKMKLRAPEPDQDKVTAEAGKADTVKTDSLKKTAENL